MARSISWRAPIWSSVCLAISYCVAFQTSRQRCAQHVFASTRLHADDTPIHLLDSRVAIASSGSQRAVKEGRIRVYGRDDTPFAGNDPPTAAYFFSPIERAFIPDSSLGFSSILQADAYFGCQLYEPDPRTGIARIREAACWRIRAVSGLRIATPWPYQSIRVERGISAPILAKISPCR